MLYLSDKKIICEVGGLTEVEVTVIGREPKHLNSFFPVREVSKIWDWVCVPAMDISRQGLRLRKTLPSSVVYRINFLSFFFFFFLNINSFFFLVFFVMKSIA